ncbi:MAG: efflux RND transporter periplasmic adaptor subunit [Gemmataceae bacterium]|nr:efflux RND transporter periplasmic adaptor subunit [Gemmataceae bacterium]
MGTLLRASLLFGWAGVVLVSSFGCGRKGVAAPTGGSTVSPSKVVLARSVELTVAQQRSLVYRVETVGVLEAEGQTEIAAGVAGVVDEVFFREGDEVGPGTLLATVDQARYLAEDDLARANVERAKAQLDLMRDLNDRTERAGRAVSEDDRAKARGAVKIAEAEYLSAVAALTRARHNLERSRVRAPYSGRINKRLVTKGSYLEERTPIATIADLSRIRLVGWVPETAAPTLRELLRTQDQRLAAARAGLAAAALGADIAATTLWLNGPLLARDYVLSGYDPEFELLALPGPVFHGRIFYMSTVAQADTHMFEAKAEVLGWPGDAPSAREPNPGESPNADAQQGVPRAAAEEKGPRRKTAGRFDPKLWPGFTAKIRFPLRSHPNACVIPEEAVRASERGWIVFVPVQQSREDGQQEWVARARTVVLGYRAEGWVEVQQGLHSGEWLVRRGAEALEDGTPIKFQVGPH